MTPVLRFCFSYKADTIVVYLSALIGFLQWVAAEIDGAPDCVPRLIQRAKLWRTSFRQDRNEESTKASDDVISAWMMLEFSGSDEVKAIKDNIMDDRRRRRTLTELYACRNTLMCLILLDQAKRSGDVAHMTVESVTTEEARCRALVAEGGGYPEDHVIKVRMCLCVLKCGCAIVSNLRSTS